MTQLKEHKQTKSEAEFKSQDYFQYVLRIFEKSLQIKGASQDRYYKIGGQVIHLRFVGTAMAEVMTPALIHLEIDPHPEPGLTICLGDGLSMRLPQSLAQWNSDDPATSGGFRYYTDDRIYIVYQIDAYLFSMIDVERNLAFLWTSDVSKIPYYVNGAPIHSIFHYWFRKHKQQIVHAASVGTKDGAVLIVGKGGSGKSTSALACLNAGMYYLGDDYTLISNDSNPLVYSLYCSGKVNVEDMDRFPQLQARVGNDQLIIDQKTLYFLGDVFPLQFISHLPIKAVLLPVISGIPNSQLSKTSAAAVLKALAPSTLFQLPGAGEQAFRTMVNCVSKVQTFNLELGSDISTIPTVITNYLSGN